jgi:hypothetical protein
LSRRPSVAANITDGFRLQQFFSIILERPVILEIKRFCKVLNKQKSVIGRKLVCRIPVLMLQAKNKVSVLPACPESRWPMSPGRGKEGRLRLRWIKGIQGK